MKIVVSCDHVVNDYTCCSSTESEDVLDADEVVLPFGGTLFCQDVN